MYLTSSSFCKNNPNRQSPFLPNTELRLVGKFSKVGAASSGIVMEELKKREDFTLNYEKGGAFTMDAASRLYTEICTSMIGEDKFYVKGSKHDSQILDDIRAVAQTEPELLFKLAAYARNEMKLRSSPIFLLAEAASYPVARQFVEKYTPMILKRADEPNELLSLWVTRFGSIGDAAAGLPVPNQLKRGINKALESFDEYQLEKYNRDGLVNLRDVLRITHPKPNTVARAALYYYLTHGWDEECDTEDLSLKEQLPIIAAKREFTKLPKDALEGNAKEAFELMKKGHITWEVAVSQFGNKKIVWDSLDLPIFATVRNLRNMIEAKATQAIDIAIAKLGNEKVIAKSRMLPFRFYQAQKELEKYWQNKPEGFDPFTIQKLNDALSKAVELSIKNVSKLKGRTAVFVDLSGSMDVPMSEKSKVTYKEISSLFGALTSKISANESDAIVIGFAEYAKWIPVQDEPVLAAARKIRRERVGYATYVNEAFKVLGGTYVDRIILFSDMQCYSRSSYAPTTAPSLKNYKLKVNPGVYFYSADLCGYGTVQIPQDEPNVALIAGWSEKILDFIPAFEEDKKQAVERIRQMYV